MTPASQPPDPALRPGWSSPSLVSFSFLWTGSGEWQAYLSVRGVPSTCPHQCHFVHTRELRDKGIYTQQHVTHGSRTEQVSFPNSAPTPEQSTPRTQRIPLPKGSHLAHVQPEVPAVFNSCPGFAVREVLFWLLLFLKCECVCARTREYVCVYMCVKAGGPSWVPFSGTLSISFWTGSLHVPQLTNYVTLAGQ